MTKANRLTDGERAGRCAIVYLLMILVATWFTVICIGWYHIKEWVL